MNDVEAMQEIVRKAFWQVHYHERALHTAHKSLAQIKSFFVRCNITVTDYQIKKFKESYDEDDLHDGNVTPELIGAALLESRLDSIQWHEVELKKAHEELASAKALMNRGNFTKAEVDFEKIDNEQRKRAYED